MYPINCGLVVTEDSSEADKIRSVAVRLSHFLPQPSPLVHCQELSTEFGRPVLLKLEHELPSGAFKIRGAFNKISGALEGLIDGQARPKFVTSSSGNHVLACCHVWQTLGIQGSAVFVPDTVAPAKEAKLRHLQETGLIRLNKGGRECLKAEQAGREFSLQTPSSVYVPPYSDWDVIRGQGTSAFEIFPDPEKTSWPGQLKQDWLPRANSGDHVTILVPTGGGGLLAGVALYAKLGASVRTTVIGCQPTADCVLAKSVEAGRLLTYEEAGSRETLAQGTAGGVEEGSPTFGICQTYVDRWCMVKEAEIARDCIRLEEILLARGRPRAEPASALGLAALRKLCASGELPPGPVVVLVTGGNVGDAEMETVRRLADR